MDGFCFERARRAELEIRESKLYDARCVDLTGTQALKEKQEDSRQSKNRRAGKLPRNPGTRRPQNGMDLTAGSVPLYEAMSYKGAIHFPQR